MLTSEDNYPNIYTVLNTMVLTIGPIVTTIVTYLLTRNQNRKIVASTDSAIHETIKGNEAIAEVHKTVNGRTDAMLAENQRLNIELAKAQTIIASRRSTD